MPRHADPSADLPPAIPYDIAPQIRDTCLCLHLQRAARVVARGFDEALRPLGLTNGQFSLLTALHRPVPASIGDLSALLGMDRTTLTAALKPLARRGLVSIVVDTGDKRGRRVALTPAGRDVLRDAVPIWRKTHRAIERRLDGADPDRVRAGLRALS